MCYLIGFEKHSAPKSDHMKENGVGDPTNQKSNKKLQPDNSVFSRSHLQASSGRGPGMYSPPRIPTPKTTPNLSYYEILQVIEFQVCANLWTRTISKGTIPSLNWINLWITTNV